MSARSSAILARFPSHLEAQRPGKRLGDVTQALAINLDTLSVALARVRRARRLLDADELRDLLRIGALHGITRAELDVLFTRLALVRPAPARAVLLDAIRRRIAAICDNHAHGNGTLRSLIDGAANALDLDVRSVTHSSDRYVHSAVVDDRLRGALVTDGEVTPAQEHLLIEENPITPAATGAEARTHAELFSVLRRGFERETLQVHVTGVENRTIGPMLVNRDEAHGVGFSGAVPGGATVDFTEEGRVVVDGTDLTSMAYAWRGACFADATALRAVDRAFDGPGVPPERRATFATATPAGALDAAFAFPHAGDSLPMPGIAVGETRFAFFVQEAAFSGSARVQPRPAVAFADGSVFAAGGSEIRQTAAVVSLAWHERAAFWVNLWIPRRFLTYTPTDDEGRATLGHVAFALNRFRPAGVQVDVKFQDDRWVLGRGTVGEVVGPGLGTELWSAPKE